MIHSIPAKKYQNKKSFSFCPADLDGDFYILEEVQLIVEIALVKELCSTRHFSKVKVPSLFWLILVTKGPAVVQADNKRMKSKNSFFMFSPFCKTKTT